MNCNVKDYGAHGDGIQKDTAAMQTAIDCCHQSGGGTVLVPSGIFICGTLWLKSRVELHLENGAVIKGSPDLADYNADDAFPQNEVFAVEEVSGAHLIIALEAEDVSISGLGEINGNSDAFFDKDAPLCWGKDWQIRTRRPGQMIYFCECRRVTVKDVALRDSCYWTLFIHGCENVIVQGLRVENSPHTRNGDGIDIDCCRNVAVSNCLINSGDDCITLRAHVRPLKRKMICENITVSNCILSTPCNAVRVGVGDGIVRDCVLSNLVIRDTGRGLCVISKYSDFTPRGASIDNISFSQITIDAEMPFDIAVGAAGQAEVKNLYFSHIRARNACRSSYLSGVAGIPLKNIRFDDIRVEMTGGDGKIASAEELKTSPPEWSRPGRPTAFFLREVDGCEFSRTEIVWDQVDPVWKHVFMLENAKSVRLESCRSLGTKKLLGGELIVGEEPVTGILETP